MYRSKIIRTIVEGYFAVGNLAELGRTRPYPFMRYIYFKLAREFTDESLTSIGRTIKKDHATVLHGLQKFDDLCGQKFFNEFEDHYKVLRNQMQKAMKDGEINEVERTIQTAEEIKELYRLKFFRLVEKNHKVIKNMHKINEFELLPKIAELPADDVDEFKVIVASFYNRKRRELTQSA